MSSEERKSHMVGLLTEQFNSIPHQGAARLYDLRLDLIDPNPDQPRKYFDEDNLRSLAASIERYGLKQPIVVRQKDDGRYLLVSGERRYRAHQLLGRERIYGVLDDGTMNVEELALIENTQREDLNPVDLAASVAGLIERHGHTLESVGQIVGIKSKSSVSELLLLNSLPQEIKDEVRTSEHASKSVLLEIAKLGDSELQRALWEQVKTGQATVRMLRQQKEHASATPRQMPALTEKALGHSFARRLKRIPPEMLAGDQSRDEELVRLRAEIDALIEGVVMIRNGEVVEQSSQ